MGYSFQAVPDLLSTVPAEHIAKPKALTAPYQKAKMRISPAIFKYNAHGLKVKVKRLQRAESMTLANFTPQKGKTFAQSVKIVSKLL